MWTGPLICWRVGVRNSTHVSYLLIEAGVNAGRLSSYVRRGDQWPGRRCPKLRGGSSREGGPNLEHFIVFSDPSGDCCKCVGFGYSRQLWRSSQHSGCFWAAITRTGRARPGPHPRQWRLGLGSRAGSAPVSLSFRRLRRGDFLKRLQMGC